MPSKIKNTIIVLVVLVILAVSYFYFTSNKSNQADLVSSSTYPVATTVTSASITGDFLSLLLSVRGIKLNDSIFSEKVWSSLRDSSVTLTPDGTEGRPNPFAPIGRDIEPVKPAPTSSDNLPSEISPDANTATPPTPETTTPLLPKDNLPQSSGASSSDMSEADAINNELDQIGADLGSLEDATGTSATE